MNLSVAFLFFLSVALFSGCTHNLTKADYENDSQFFNEVNSIAEDRTVWLETKDSTFIAENIKCDDKELNGVIKKTQNPFTWNEKTIEKTFTVPASELKSISVTKRTGSISEGAFIGMFAGVMWGGTFFDLGGDSNSGHHPDYTVGAIFAGLAGTIIGGLAGAIVGDDYVFSTQDRLSRAALFSDNSAHKYGLKFGYTNGYNTGIVLTEGISYSNVHLRSQPAPGFSMTFFYNYPLGKNFSLNNELSYISAGSDKVYSIGVPVQPDQYYYRDIQTSSVENVKIIEIAPIIRLNLIKNIFTPYFILGPKFDLIIPPSNSHEEKFYNDLNTQYGGTDFSLSGRYSRFIWGGVIGAGISTGKLFPYEILLEARYCMDGSDLFTIHSYARNYPTFPGEQTRWDIGQKSQALIFNAGIAIF